MKGQISPFLKEGCRLILSFIFCILTVKLMLAYLTTFSMLFSLVLLSPAQGSERVVVYSWPKSMQVDERGAYPIELLKLALSKSNRSFVAKPSEFAMSQYRTLKHLEMNKGIDVVWTMTNAEREQQLRPIRIPIDRGLIGWRLLAIQQKDTEIFHNLPNETVLKTLLTVQGIDWPDYAILKSNGFKVASSNYFDGMYQMLHVGRVRFFARSLTEIWPELTALREADKSVVVAPRWVLHYPAALYFFVRNDDDELATAIESGLETALADGSMRTLFLQHFQDSLNRADLQHREIVKLSNQGLPPQTPTQRFELWFNPEKGY